MSRRGPTTVNAELPHDATGCMLGRRGEARKRKPEDLPEANKSSPAGGSSGDEGKVPTTQVVRTFYFFHKLNLLKIKFKEEK